MCFVLSKNSKIDPVTLKTYKLCSTNILNNVATLSISLNITCWLFYCCLKVHLLWINTCKHGITGIICFTLVIGLQYSAVFADVYINKTIISVSLTPETGRKTRKNNGRLPREKSQCTALIVGRDALQRSDETSL